jgi:hypothetical protein
VQILTQKALLGNHSRLQLVCAGCCGNGLLGALRGTYFTGFTGTKVQILTAEELHAESEHVAREAPGGAFFFFALVYVLY